MSFPVRTPFLSFQCQRKAHLSCSSTVCECSCHDTQHLRYELGRTLILPDAVPLVVVV